jgi:hypothetical protein
VSAIVAIPNLIVVVILFVYNRRTLLMLEEQTLAARAQAELPDISCMN